MASGPVGWSYPLKATLSNPFPGGITPPFGRNQGLNRCARELATKRPSGNNPPPYVQQWNLDIQRQFPGNTLIDIAYAGSKGTHLPMHDQTLDQLPAAVFAPDRTERRESDSIPDDVGE